MPVPKVPEGLLLFIQHSLRRIMIDDGNHDSWYAIRTFNAQEFKVGQYLEQMSLPNFIPMSRLQDMSEDGQVIWKTRPVVHNLLFVRKSVSEEQIREILLGCPYPLSVYRRQDAARSWCEISYQDMFDLRLMCDTAFCEPTFITQKEYEMKEGQIVRVVHGPLSGIRGKLVRKNKKYYIMKSLGMNSSEALGIMVSVSRWCCVPEGNGEP